MKTQAEVRKSFWNTYSQYAQYYKKSKRQNEYMTDIRCAFVDYIDSLRRDGIISEKLANRVTL
jgi:hypothetical protein